jgi:hypothetical protein
MERRKAIAEAVQGPEASGARKKKLQDPARNSGEGLASFMRWRFKKFSGEGRGIKILAMLGVLLGGAGYVYSNLIRQEIRLLVSESGAWQSKNSAIKNKIDSLNALQNRLAEENLGLSQKLDSLRLIHLALIKPADSLQHWPGVEMSLYDLSRGAVAAASSVKIIKRVDAADPLGEGQMQLRDPEAIQTMISKHNAMIHAVYKQALKQNPHLKGNLTIRSTIDAAGAWSIRKLLKMNRHCQPRNSLRRFCAPCGNGRISAQRPPSKNSG